MTKVIVFTKITLNICRKIKRMKKGDKVFMENKFITLVKMFSSTILEVSGVKYQQWHCQYTTESGKVIECLDWVKVS